MRFFVDQCQISCKQVLWGRWCVKHRRSRSDKNVKHAYSKPLHICDLKLLKTLLPPHPRPLLLEHSALSSLLVRLTGYTFYTDAFLPKQSDLSRSRIYCFHAHFQLPAHPPPPRVPSCSNPGPHALQNSAFLSPDIRQDYRIHLIKRCISLHSCQILSPSKTGYIFSAHRLTNTILLTLMATLCSCKGSRRPISLMRTHNP